jgi:cell wall-associated NlpC family hydrolase
VERQRFVADYVAAAERFVGVPYLWGGKTRFGLDCSGLLQTALCRAAGRLCPRDSDMQEAELGPNWTAATVLDALERGDLVFWQGHVGIMADGFMLLHANAHHMAVVVEPVRSAVERIGRAACRLVRCKRLRKDVANGGSGVLSPPTPLAPHEHARVVALATSHVHLLWHRHCAVGGGGVAMFGFGELAWVRRAGSACSSSLSRSPPLSGSASVVPLRAAPWRPWTAVALPSSAAAAGWPSTHHLAGQRG